VVVVVVEVVVEEVVVASSVAGREEGEVVVEGADAFTHGGLVRDAGV
jgi:hypothetical protein